MLPGKAGSLCLEGVGPDTGWQQALHLPSQKTRPSKGCGPCSRQIDRGQVCWLQVEPRGLRERLGASLHVTPTWSRQSSAYCDASVLHGVRGKSQVTPSVHSGHPKQRGNQWRLC